MKVISVEPVAGELLLQIRQGLANSAAAVGVSLEEAPGAIVKGVDQFVFDWQDGKRDTANGDTLTDEDLPFCLGPLWGEQLVRDKGWSWVAVKFEDDSSAIGVASADRSMVIYPFHFLMGCVQDPTVDVTLMLMWNMLEGGKLASLRPNEMAHVMAQVHRIVPRR